MHSVFWGLKFGQILFFGSCRKLALFFFEVTLDYCYLFWVRQNSELFFWVSKFKMVTTFQNPKENRFQYGIFLGVNNWSSNFLGFCFEAFYLRQTQLQCGLEQLC